MTDDSRHHAGPDGALPGREAGERPRVKPWGGRFTGEQAPLFERINASLPFDYVLAPYDIAGSQAHVRMLCRIGVLTEEEKAALVEGLRRVQEEMESGTFAWDLRDEDIHMAVERRLTEMVGPVGGKVHTARSRNDQVALDLQLYLRDAVEGHLARLLRVLVVLCDRAREMQDMIMPGYTHLQRAQPVTVGYHLLAYFFMFSRDADRLVSWFRSSWMPLGSGALAGVNYAVDREMVAAELGFARIAPNAMDAVASRDTALEYSAIATSCALNLSRLAEELVLWSSQEFGFITLPDAWSSGSSIMPQKRNPDAAELIRGKAAGFIGRLTSLATLLKGLPLAYNKDLQEDKLYVFATREELDVCLEAAAAMVAAASFHPERLRAAAEGGYAQATDVADHLVRKGVPFREAHSVAGRLVALAALDGRALSELTVAELTSVSPLLDRSYYEVVKLERVVEGKISRGGTAAAAMAVQLEEAEAIVWGVEGQLQHVRERIRQGGAL